MYVSQGESGIFARLNAALQAVHRLNTICRLEAVTIIIINALFEVLRKSVQNVGTDWVR